MNANNVIQLHPRCGRCGTAARRVSLCLDGDVVAEFSACQGCLDKISEELSRVRPVFDAMIDAGISRENANKTMTYLLEIEGG